MIEFITAPNDLYRFVKVYVIQEPKEKYEWKYPHYDPTSFYFIIKVDSEAIANKILIN